MGTNTSIMQGRVIFYDTDDRTDVQESLLGFGPAMLLVRITPKGSKATEYYVGYLNDTHYHLTLVMKSTYRGIKAAIRGPVVERDPNP